MSNGKQEITQLLTNLKNGDSSSREELMRILYKELRNFAGNILRKENQTITLQATELVNEAFIRLFDSKKLDWNDKNHFLSSAILVMRRFLVDHARKKNSGIRINKKQMDVIDDSVITESMSTELIALDDALNDLEKLDKRQVRIVELRFFGGLTETEVAAILDVSVSTVNREWRAAKLWLSHQISRQ